MVLKTFMDVDVPSFDGHYYLSRIEIVSFVSEGGVNYEFKNNGKSPIYMHLNLSKTEEFAEIFHSFGNPLFLKAFGEEKVFVRVSEETVSEAASLIVWSEAKEVVGIGSAGVYGMASGRKDITPEDIWFKVVE